MNSPVCWLRAGALSIIQFQIVNHLLWWCCGILAISVSHFSGASVIFITFFSLSLYFFVM